MKIVLAAGGTAGHINPALAIADKFRSIFPDCDILFVGAEGLLKRRVTASRLSEWQVFSESSALRILSAT